MNLVAENPYRIVGLLVGSTAREQEKQVKRLKQYLEAEQEPQDDFSFPILGRLNRNVDKVTEAESKLNLDNDKFNAALFWFYNGNSITDEPAFNALKDSDMSSAQAVWTKLISSGEITQKNCSAFQNLSTLLLCKGLNGDEIDQNLLEYGLQLKLKFLDSNYSKDLQAKATDTTFKITKKEIQINFLNSLQQEIEKLGGISTVKLIEMLSKIEFTAKDDYLKTFAHELIQEIETNIEQAKTKRKSNKADSGDAGKKLYKTVNGQLNQLKSILRETDFKFTTISDKVSDEMLQCGIDYFLTYKDTETDPSSISMDLFKKAKIFATGNLAKQRCLENTENLQEWINEKPERDKQKIIADELQFITSKLERFQNLSDNIANSKDLAESCKPHLEGIKAKLGQSDEFYQLLSSAVARNANGMLFTFVLEELELFKFVRKVSNCDIQKVVKILSKRTGREISNLNNGLIDLLIEAERVSQHSRSVLSNRGATEPQQAITNFQAIIRDATSISISISRLDMNNEIRSECNNVQSFLQSIGEQIGITRSNTSGASSPKNSSGGGCYIATMAYGYYDHPQVLELRRFRDEILGKSFIGRIFIKTYYSISPKLVTILKDQKIANILIRKTLNQIVKIIKR